MYPFNKKAIDNYSMADLRPPKPLDGMIFEC